MSAPVPHPFRESEPRVFSDSEVSFLLERERRSANEEAVMLTRIGIGLAVLGLTAGFFIGAYVMSGRLP